MPGRTSPRTWCRPRRPAPQPGAELGSASLGQTTPRDHTTGPAKARDTSWVRTCTRQHRTKDRPMETSTSEPTFEALQPPRRRRWRRKVALASALAILLVLLLLLSQISGTPSAPAE